MEFARLCAMAFIHKDKKLAAGVKIRGQIVFDFLNEFLHVSVTDFPRGAELVDQRTDQPFSKVIEGARQVSAASSTIDLLVDSCENLLDLFIQLAAVGDD